MMYLAFMICLSATLTLGNETQNTKIVKKIAMKITYYEIEINQECIILDLNLRT